MMYKVESLVVAEAVIEKVMHIINGDNNMPAALPADAELDFRVAVECYQNGREHGFIAWPLFKSAVAYYICQSRRSDSICIYKGKYGMQSITDDAYKHPNTFDTTDNAAEWLVLDLITLFIAEDAAMHAKVQLTQVEPSAREDVTTKLRSKR